MPKMATEKLPKELSTTMGLKRVKLLAGGIEFDFKGHKNIPVLLFHIYFL